MFAVEKDKYWCRFISQVSENGKYIVRWIWKSGTVAQDSVPFNVPQSKIATHEHTWIFLFFMFSEEELVTQRLSYKPSLPRPLRQLLGWDISCTTALTQSLQHPLTTSHNPQAFSDTQPFYIFSEEGSVTSRPSTSAVLSLLGTTRVPSTTLSWVVIMFL